MVGVSLVVIWTAELREGAKSNFWYFIDPSGKPFKGKTAVLKFLDLRESKKPRLRVSSRETKTIEEGRNAEQRERQPSCLELRGLACKASRDCDFVAEDEDELTRHRIEFHGLSGDDAVQNPKWPCSKCLDKLCRARYDCSGDVCTACTYMAGGRRKPKKLVLAEDKLRIAKWRREKGLVE